MSLLHHASCAALVGTLNELRLFDIIGTASDFPSTKLKSNMSAESSMVSQRHSLAQLRWSKETVIDNMAMIPPYPKILQRAA